MYRQVPRLDARHIQKVLDEADGPRRRPNDGLDALAGSLCALFWKLLPKHGGCELAGVDGVPQIVGNDREHLVARLDESRVFDRQGRTVCELLGQTKILRTVTT